MQDIIEFLKSHPLLSLNELEKQCEIPQSTLSRALSGNRGLPDKYKEKLIIALAKYGFEHKK